MKKIKIAQIGVGHDHAADIVTVLRQKSDIYELVGYCTVPEDSGNLPNFSYSGHKSAYDGVKLLTLEELLNYEGLQAVCIETEDRALTKYALLAAEKGLHIHMDKPGGILNSEFDRLIATVKAKGLVFHTGYMYRYNPAVIQLKEDIKKGKLGEIISVQAQMNCRHGLEKRDWLGNYPGGMLYFLGCHMVDLVYSLMGEPEEIIPFSCSSGLEGTKACDFGMAVLKYKNGASLVQSSAVEVGGFGRRQITVSGSLGTVEIKPLESSASDSDLFVPLFSSVRTVFQCDKTVEKAYTTESFGRYDAMLRAFADYVNVEKENPFDYEYERKLHRVLLRCCGELL